MIRPMANWLRSLFVRQPGNFRRSARDQAEVDALNARHDAFKANYRPPTTPSDYALRLQKAAGDPGFAAKRDAALKIITARLDLQLKPHGFTRKGAIWTGPSGNANASLRLTRGKIGTECLFELTHTPAPGLLARHPVTAHFGSFLQPGDEPHRDGGSVGWIEYLLVLENPANLDTPMRVLETRALPWLLAQGQWRPPGTDRFRDLPL
jgi:hypothetical protein